MVITVISSKTEKGESGASGDNGTRPAGSDESAANGEPEESDKPQAAGKHSGRARQGPLIGETVSGKITDAALTAAWEALSLNKVF